MTTHLRDGRDTVELFRLARSIVGGESAVEIVLDWLENRSGLRVGLIDPHGVVAATAPLPALPLPGPADTDGMPKFPDQPHDNASAEQGLPLRCGTHFLHDGQAWALFPLDDGRHTLAATGPPPLHPRSVELIADATWVVGLCHERARRQGELTRLEAADAASRAGVFELLKAGEAAAARRVAVLAGRPLPDVVRIFVVETDPADSLLATSASIAVASELSRLASGRRPGQPEQAAAWVHHCNVVRSHTMVIAPAALRHFPSAVRAVLRDRCRVAASRPLPVEDAAAGYLEAAAALTAPPLARRRIPAVPHAAASGSDTDAARLGYAPTVGAVGRRWAADFLRPVHAHRGARLQDPSGEDLIATARCWLAHGSEAPARLYLHRNTVTSRLNRMGALLGSDLSLVAGQAELTTALRYAALPPVPSGNSEHIGDNATAPAFGDVLAEPALRAWALAFVGTAVDLPSSPAALTLRVWLDYDCRARAAAYVLGISVPALRKRLHRLGTRLGVDLGDPAAQRDVWLAMEAVRLPG